MVKKIQRLDQVIYRKVYEDSGTDGLGAYLKHISKSLGYADIFKMGIAAGVAIGSTAKAKEGLNGYNGNI